MSQDGSWAQLFEELFDDWREENKRELEVSAFYAYGHGIEVSTKRNDWRISSDGSVHKL